MQSYLTRKTQYYSRYCIYEGLSDTENYIYYTKKVKDIKYPELFCVVHICYACTHSIYQLHKKSSGYLIKDM